MNIQVPTFEQVQEKMRNKQPLTALDTFVYEWAPDPQENDWRSHLKTVVEFVQNNTFDT